MRTIMIALALIALASAAHAVEPLPKSTVEAMSPDCQERYRWLLMRVNGLQEMEAGLKSGQAIWNEKGEWLRGAEAARWLAAAMDAATVDVRALKRDCVK
jgi:hypothetical protein